LKAHWLTASRKNLSIGLKPVARLRRGLLPLIQRFTVEINFIARVQKCDYSANILHLSMNTKNKKHYVQDDLGTDTQLGPTSPYDDPHVSTGEIADYLDQLRGLQHLDKSLQNPTDCPSNSACCHKEEHRFYQITREDPLEDPIDHDH
jgi:hypothetical protein